jgi:hypothetical protein
MAKNKPPGSISQREENLEARKERKLAHAVSVSQMLLTNPGECPFPQIKNVPHPLYNI